MTDVAELVVADLVADVVAVVEEKLAEIDDEIGRRTAELADLTLARERIEHVLAEAASINHGAPESEPEPERPKTAREIVREVEASSKPGPRRRSRRRRRPGGVVEDVYAWITANVEPEADIFSSPIVEALQMERSSTLRALEKLAEDGRLRFDRREKMTAARGRASKVYRLVELGTV